MRLARLLLALLVTLVLASSANAAPSASAAAPQSLHGFLFRADEPVRHEFARTPSFAWAPVPGATSYQLELATSSTFRENGLLYADRALPGRVDHAHPPWITGAPYSLYARVRAVFRAALRRGTSPSASTCARQSTTSSHDYPIAALDAGRRHDRVRRVADDIPKMHLRQRHGRRGSTPSTRRTVDRRCAGASARCAPTSLSGQVRANGLPVSSFGGWSCLRVGQPALRSRRAEGAATVSDVVSKGLSSDRAHRLMPAFVYGGNRGFAGLTPSCTASTSSPTVTLNRVFTGAITGGPAYASLVRPADAAQEHGRSPPSIDLPHRRRRGSTYGRLRFGHAERVAAAAGPHHRARAAPTTPTTPDSDHADHARRRAENRRDLGQRKPWRPVDLWDTNWPEGGTLDGRARRGVTRRRSRRPPSVGRDPAAGRSHRRRRYRPATATSATRRTRKRSPSRASPATRSASRRRSNRRTARASPCFG